MNTPGASIGGRPLINRLIHRLSTCLFDALSVLRRRRVSASFEPVMNALKQDFWFDGIYDLRAADVYVIVRSDVDLQQWKRSVVFHPAVDVVLYLLYCL